MSSSKLRFPAGRLTFNLATLTFGFLLTSCKTDGATGPNIVNTVVPLSYLAVSGRLTPVIGQPYARQFSAQGGRPPYTWSVTGGTLPAGLTLSPAGLLTGTPTGSGSYFYNIKLTDSKGASSGGNMSGTLNTSGTIPFAVGQFALPAYGQNQDFGYQPFFEGGTPPYTFTITGLPAGVTFDPATGTMSGRPTTSGIYKLMVTLKDAKGVTAAGTPSTVTVVVNPPQVVSGKASSVYDGTYNGQFNMQYHYFASGGVRVDGSASFSATLTFQSFGPAANGESTLLVTHAIVSSPFFGCEVGGCTPTIGNAVLPNPPVNVSTQAGEGIEIVFPNGASLGTLSDPGALHTSTDGRIISNSLDPSIQPNNTWTTTVWTAVNVNTGQSFEDYAVPAARPASGRLFMDHATWAFARSSP